MKINKYNKNLLAFIASNSTVWEVFPPEDTFLEVWKNNIFNLINDYINSWNYDKNPYLSLYFNFPYCNEKCSYCCLASIWLNNLQKIREFIRELIIDIKKVWKIMKQKNNIRIDVLYFSWGTFTIIEDNLFEEFLKTIKENFNFKKDYSYNIEVHPSSTTEKKISIMKKYWVNRIMVWIQSLNENVLKNVNRIQTRKQIFNAIDLVKKYKFEILDIDIIAWLPWEDIKWFISNLKLILEKISPDIIHMYPFAPWGNVPYTKLWNIYSEQEKRNRDIMFWLWEKLIYKYWYYKSDWYVKNWKIDNSIWSIKCKIDMSIISFWYPLDIQWYLEWIWMYTSWYNNIYALYKYNNNLDILIRREMFRFSWLWIDINLVYFKEKYKINILQYLKKEIDFLINEDVIYIENNFIKSRLKYIWEKTIYRWIFLTEDLFERFLEKNKYDETKNYIEYFKKDTGEFYS